MEVENEAIQNIHLSAGGVGPIPKYLSNTCDFLRGKQIDDRILEEAIAILQNEISPISDARGSADYKRLLLRQLFLAHMHKFFPQLLTPEKIVAL